MREDVHGGPLELLAGRHAVLGHELGEGRLSGVVEVEREVGGPGLDVAAHELRRRLGRREDRLVRPTREEAATAHRFQGGIRGQTAQRTFDLDEDGGV